MSDTGNAATGQLVATITLPTGASMWLGNNGDHAGSGAGWPDRWSCQPTSKGASCQHAGISAGSKITGWIPIVLNDTSACGQPVEVSVVSGSASASATSPSGISCQQG